MGMGGNGNRNSPSRTPLVIIVYHVALHYKFVLFIFAFACLVHFPVFCVFSCVGLLCFLPDWRIKIYI